VDDLETSIRLRVRAIERRREDVSRNTVYGLRESTAVVMSERVYETERPSIAPYETEREANLRILFGEADPRLYLHLIPIFVGMPKISVEIPQELLSDLDSHVGDDGKYVNRSEAVRASIRKNLDILDEIDERHGRLEDSERS
jgi:hypothetical protein